jgi:hypothetical protein
LDIDHWLKISGDAYKKQDVRKLIVEPFLKLMEEHQITTSPKQLPRSRIFDALFNWLGVESGDRSTSASINAIARELSARACASEADTMQRTEN